jgi:tetratricopeptide (TPR) repeat protein
MESNSLSYLIYLILILIVTVFFYARNHLHKRSFPPSQKHKSSANSDDFKRKELQSIDSGAIISPVESQRTSAHWQKYKEGNALIDQQKMDEAIVIFQSLITIPEEEETALISLGTCYNLKGESEKAMDCFKRSLQLNDKNYNALLGMASANYKTAHYPIAIVYYKKANALHPELPDSYWGLASAYHMLQEKELASENAKTFIQMVPDSRYRKYLEGMIIH